LQASPAAPASARRPHAQGAPPGRAAGWPSRGSSSLRFTSRKAAPKADTKPGPCSMLLRAWATRQPLHPRSQQDARGRRGRQDGAARAQPYDTLGACRARSLARRPPRISHAAAARMSRTRAGLQARLKTRSSLRARGGPAIRAAGRARAGSDDLHVRQRVPPALPAPCRAAGGRSASSSARTHLDPARRRRHARRPLLFTRLQKSPTLPRSAAWGGGSQAATPHRNQRLNSHSAARFRHRVGSGVGRLVLTLNQVSHI